MDNKQIYRCFAKQLFLWNKFPIELQNRWVLVNPNKQYEVKNTWIQAHLDLNISI